MYLVIISHGQCVGKYVGQDVGADGAVVAAGHEERVLLSDGGRVTELEPN
jgi:hypothetical protein